MNSRSKPAGTRKTGARAKKPATIDLKAKEVGADAEKAASDRKSTTAKPKTAAAPTAAKSAETPGTQKTEKPLGRAGAASKNDDATKQASKEPEKKSADAPKPASAPKSAQKRDGGFLSGLIGAAAAVVGLGAIGQFDGAKDIPLIGSIYSGGSGQVVNEEIATLSRQVEALKSAGASVDLGPVNERLARIEELTASPLDAETTSRLNQIETDLGGLSETLSEISESASDGNNAGSEAIAAAISSVTGRMEKLEAEVSRLASTPATTDTVAREQLAALQSKLEEAVASSNVDLSPIETRLGEIESSMSSVRDNVTANADGLAALNNQSSALQETVASVKASEKIARSVAVNALGAALENDDPISLAIASIESLGGKSAETERLSEIATEGVPSRESLLAELSVLTNTVQNPVANTQSGSISERFWANAQNLVSFRSSGPQTGDTPVAVLSRIKANLEADNLSGVTLEWEKLPAEIRQSGESWINKVSKRIEAFELYKTLSDNLTAAAG